MRKAILLKTLIDILFFFFIVKLIAACIPLISAFAGEMKYKTPEDTPLWITWFLFTVGPIGYFILLRGIYFLRKAARPLMSNQQFSSDISRNLKRSGQHFLLSAIVYFTISMTLWLSKLEVGHLYLKTNNNLTDPLFLAIIGTFFIIQSDSLSLAKVFKEENDLTV